MAEGDQLFGSILLAGRSGTLQGQLRFSANGVVWRKSGGGRTVEIPQKDMEGWGWTKTSKGGLLAINRKQDSVIQFLGFRDNDLESVQAVAKKLGMSLKEEAASISGRSWGKADVENATLTFKVDSKVAFRLPLADVGQVQQGREEVMLELPVDDTAGGDRQDALVEMAFYVPANALGYPAEDDRSSAQVFYDQLMQNTDAGAAVGDAVATFDNVAVVAPRGRFDVEMYLSFFKLVGQAQDYRIQYDSIVRLFVLPKSNSPQTLVVVSLDPPIRKGQTYYPHILLQFQNDEMRSLELDIPDDAFNAKNAKCGGKLQRMYDAEAYEVFSRVLRGLSAAKLTRPSSFRTSDGSGYAVRCSFKADDGFLYPLERAFFYVNKPPTLLVYEEVESVEFLRQGGGVLAASARTFDLSIRLRSDQEYLFGGIHKSEWTNLFNWIQAKKLRIENLREAELGPGGGRGLDLGGDVDTGIARLNADMDDSEEDEDFQAGAEEEEEDDDEEDEEDDEEGGAPAGASPTATEAKKSKVVGEKKKREKKPPKEKPAAAEGKKKRAKKDKNAPKKGMTAYMFFLNSMREKIKADNPGCAFGEVAKIGAEMWKAADEDTKAKYEKMAKDDKARYLEQKKEYDAKKAAEAADTGDISDVADD